MPNPSNITKQVETTSPYTTSSNSTLLRSMVDTTLNGTSPLSQSMDEVALGSRDYTNLVQAKEQDGVFSSLTDKKVFSISPELDYEFNPIKSLEKNIGVSYNYISDQSAKEKDSRVQKDNIINSQGNWGPDIFTGIDTTSPEAMKASFELLPPCIITESRTGTESYTQIDERGEFSSKDPVEVIVLQNIDNFDFGTSQNFDTVEPRGSQTPMRFYNHNSGRTLNFTAKFHQQEYPLEPLLSIAEKAQYLARPYKHSDYALIPKLVKVQIPGRIFRGYLQSVGVNYSGDDYRSWQFIDNIKDRVGTMGEQSRFYGGYTSRDLDAKGGIASGRPDITNESIDYGLSSMSITFVLLITEEINLTTYETYEEKQEREEAERKAEEERLRKEVIEQARAYVDLNKTKEMVPGPNGEGIYQSTDDCIYVDENGNVVGYRFIDDNGVLQDTTNGAGRPLTEWEKEQELKKGDTINKTETSDYPSSKSKEAWQIINQGSTRDGQINYLLGEWLNSNPKPPDSATPEVKQEWENAKKAEEERLNGLSADSLFNEFKQSAITDGIEKDNYNMAYFCNASLYYDEVGGEKVPVFNMPEELKVFLTHKIENTEDLHTVLCSIGTEDGSSLDAEVDLVQSERNGVDDRWDWKIIIEVCCEAGLGVKWVPEYAHNMQPYGIGSTAWTTPTTGDSGFAFKEGNKTGMSARQIKKIISTGYCSSTHVNDTIAFITFEKLAQITDFTKFTFTTDEEGKPLATPDDSINQFFIKAVKAIRDVFYYGFKKLCYEQITEDHAELFPTEQAALHYRESHDYAYAYWWEYDGTGKIKGTNKKS